jgi:penicillin-binding protein 1A
MVNYGAIDQATAERAKAMPVKLVNGLEVNESSGQYFKEAVRRELVDRFGWTRVSQGGLRVFTTLDIELQRSAEALVEKNLEDIEKRRGFTATPRSKLPKVKEGQMPDYLQGALIAIDPTNGYVRALVGGREFTESRFNRAIQAKRQSGSAFKPFVYAAALEAGYTPATLITRLNDPLLVNQEEWLPEDEHSDADSMTLRAALRTSSNRAAVQLLNTVGIPKAVTAAQKMNVGTPPSVPSLALGASDVTLAALTAAYGAFANGGIVRKPILIRRVEDRDGNVLYNEPGKADRAVSEATAFLMASMLADVVNAGTAYRARQSGFTLPAAGKTGTTNDYVDAWFVGFTPKLVTGVWIGFDQPRTIIRNGYAGEIAVPLWASFMKVATKDDKPEWLARPANVIGTNVCRISGKLPAGGCDHVEVVNRDGLVEKRSMIYTDYFVKGTQPTEECALHPDRGFLDALAGVFGKDSGPPPMPVGATGLPSTPPPAHSTATTGAPAAKPAPAEAEPAPQQKKRGFWSRIFGGGRDKDDDKDDKKKDDERKKEEQKKKSGG